jgi:hypothetical protein
MEILIFKTEINYSLKEGGNLRVRHFVTEDNAGK